MNREGERNRVFGMKGVGPPKKMHFFALSTFTHQCCFLGVNYILRFVLKLHKMRKRREADRTGGTETKTNRWWWRWGGGSNIRV